MIIPADVYESVREDLSLHRTRSRHLVARYAEPSCTWLFRCAVPDSRAMVGEIVLTPDGRHRVHCWSAAVPAPTYRDARALIEARALPLETTTVQDDDWMPEPPQVTWSRLMDTE